MEEIEILKEMPVVLTKDKYFLEMFKNRKGAKPGDILLLPEDAVLVILPILKSK